jgi:hypothetical protein
MLAEDNREEEVPGYEKTEVKTTRGDSQEKEPHEGIDRRKDHYH